MELLSQIMGNGVLLFILGISVIVLYSKTVLKRSIGISFESIGLFRIYGIRYKDFYVKSTSLEFGRNGKWIIFGLNSPIVKIQVNSRKSSKKELNLKNVPFSMLKIFGIVVRDAQISLEKDGIEFRVEIHQGKIGIEKILDSVSLNLDILGLQVIQEESALVSLNAYVILKDLRDILVKPRIQLQVEDLNLDLEKFKTDQKQETLDFLVVIAKINQFWELLDKIDPRIQVNFLNSVVNSKVLLEFKKINMEFSLGKRFLEFKVRINGIIGSLKEFNILNLENSSLEFKLFRPNEGMVSTLLVDLDALVLSANQKIILSDIFQNSDLKDSKSDSVVLVQQLLQYFCVQVKFKISKKQLLFSFLDEVDQTVSFGVSWDSIEMVFDAADQKEEIASPSIEFAIGHCQIFMNGMSIDVFIDQKLEFNLASCAYAHAHIGIFMAYDSSELHLHVQGAVEAIQTSLSGIRDDSSINYKKLKQYLQQTFQKNGKSQAKKINGTGVKLDGILDIPVVLIDCKSDLPSTSVRIEVRDISSKLNISGGDITSNISLSSISFIVYKGIKFSEIYRPVKNAVLVVPGITAELIKPTGKIPLLTVSTEQIQASFNLCDIYVFILSFQHIIRISKSFELADSKSSPQTTKLNCKIVSTNLEIKWQLEKDVLTRFYFSPVMLNIQQGDIEFDINEASVEVLVDVDSHKYESIFCLSEAHGDIIMANGVKAHKFLMAVTSRFLHFNVPNGYKLENVFENMINMSKAIKNLAIEHLEFVPDTYCLEGKTFIDPAEIPIIRISVKELLFTVQDDPFEISLSNNYLFGYEEQQSRIARNKEFVKLARLHKESGEYDRIDDNFQRELELLDEFNSRSWIDIVKKIRSLDRYPLFKVEAHNVDLCFSPPTLPKTTVEASLNFMDYTTPPDLIYDELIPRDITFKFSDLKAILRNYPFPLVSIPSSESVEHTWETKGLLILVGQQFDPDSMRDVELDLGPLAAPSLVVSRSMNPVKIYLNSKSVFRSSGILRLTYGASIEPCLSDMIRIIDTFSKDTIDTSPPVGWWDKLRIMIHGLNQIKVKGGEIRVRVLGSFDPYFDPRKSSGTQGIDICADKGVNIELGGDPAEGKDVVIECGQLRLSLPSFKNESQTLGDSDFIRLRGGVRLAIGIRYEIIPVGVRHVIKWIRHSEVSLKNPQSPSYEPNGDSFAGFRTRAIHITFEITSPKKFYSGLSIPINSLYLTLETINRLSSFAQVYQSVLTNQQVRTGSLFSTVTTKFQKPKLSLLINSIRLRASAYPLLFSLLAQTEDIAGFVGARIRADEMNLDLRLIQRMILKNTSNQSKTKSASKWNLQESELDFEILEMCTISSGFDDGVFEEPFFKADNDDDTHTSWFTDEDFYLTPNLSDIRICPFISSPKLTYYRRSQDPKNAAEQENRKSIDLYKVQIQLFEERLIQLEAQIWHCLKLQQSISSRMMVFFDNSLKAEADELGDQLALLYEKKAVIEAYIKRCELRINLAREEQEPIKLDGHTAPFRHQIDVHNITFLWKSNVRNVIFKLFDMIDRNYALRYCTSYSAVKTITELIKVKKADAAIQLPNKTFSYQGSSNRNAFEIKKDGQISLDYILGMLLKDVKNSNRIFVPNERMQSTDALDKNEERETGRRKSLYPPTLTRLASNLSANNYIASKDPDNPDFVAHDNFAIGDVQVQLINSQISFESLVKNEDGSTCLQSVVVTASVMHYKAISIRNKTDITFDLGYDDSDKTQNTVKNRNVYSISDAQFFIVRSTDLKLKTTLLETPMSSLDINTWPIWVPIECLIDHSLDSEDLKRVVENTAMRIIRDKHNPLFVQSKKHSNSDDLIDVMHIGFPEFEASLTSGEYLVICDTLTNLLIYKDPMRGFRNEQLKKMMIFLDQSQEEISKVLDSIVSFQEKIKRTDAFLRYDPSGSSQTEPGTDGLRKSLALYQDELFILIEAFKTTYNLETKRGSAAVNSKIGVSIDKLLWRLIDANGEFCRLTITNPQFESIGYEDSSASSTLEIDSLLIENLTNTPNSFRNVLSPYISQNTVVNFNKNKMLRFLWKEIPPVAGIQVFHHFEINIFPLLIQMTFDIGKSLMTYFFPSRGYSSGVKDTRDSSFTADDDLIFSSLQQLESAKDLKLMQSRASNNKSFIFIKVPGANHCISYKGSKEKNLEDLYMFPFFLPTLEYRNKTWSWYNFIQEIRRDAIRVIFANTGALVREKIFPKKKTLENRQGSQTSLLAADLDAAQAETASIKSKKTFVEKLLRRKRRSTSESSSNDSNVSYAASRRTKSEDAMSDSNLKSSLEESKPVTPMTELHDKGRQLFGKFYPS